MANDNAPSDKPQVLGLLGVGFDNKDGQHRVTRGEEFFLVGGSEETHERMQDTLIRVTEDLRGRGKRVRDAEVKEIVELLFDFGDG